MATAIKKLLENNGLQPKGNGSESETAEEKAAREKREKEAGAGSGNDNGGAQESPEEKAARELREKEAGGGSNNPPPGETAEEKSAREKREKEAGAGSNDDDIDDAKLLALLQKRGKKITSLDEINKEPETQLTEEQKREQEQQRRDKIRTYALHNKKVTSTDFDNYARESSMNYKDLAFRLYKEERLDELKKAGTPADQMPEEKDLRNEFDEAHFQFADDKDAKRIRSEKILQQQVDSYLQNKYSNIYDLEDDFNDFEETTNRRTGYNSLVNDAMSSVGEELTFDITEADGKTTFPFKFKISPEVKKAVTDSYLNDAGFSLFGKGNVDKALLEQAIRGNVIQREISKILSEGATAYASAKIDNASKGRRGIPPERKEEGSGSGEKKVNKVVQSILDKPENKKILQKT